MHTDHWDIALTLGLLLISALLGGRLAELVRLPKVTAYLLVGVLLGPQVLDALPESHVQTLDPITKLAMALVLFNLGCGFSLEHLRRIYDRVLPLSLAEIVLTFGMVSVGLWLIGAGPSASILLGALAIATAPATTILVLKETESEGPVTQYASAMVALNNFACILAFELLFLAIEFVHGQIESPLRQALYFTLDVFGSLTLGIGSGLLVSYLFAVADPKRHTILLFAAIAVVLGVCQTWHFPYLLTFLAMGTIVANSSDHRIAIGKQLDQLTGILCIMFFVIHGAEMQIQRFIEGGAVGFAYIGLRCLGKYFGVFTVAWMRKDEASVRNWLGATLVAQAGAAIALASIAVARDPALGEFINSIILGTVVVFELLGPILIRQAVLHSGEVPLDHAIRRRERDPIQEFRAMCNRISEIFFPPPKSDRSVEEIQAKEVLRTDIKGLQQTATFHEIIDYIEHSRDNTFPVVGSDGQLVGVIRYDELSSTLFDRRLGPLVRAADLATPTNLAVHPDESVAYAWSKLQHTNEDCLPVIDRESPHRLVGVIRRRDVLRVLIRGHRSASKSARDGSR